MKCFKEGDCVEKTQIPISNVGQVFKNVAIKIQQGLQVAPAYSLIPSPKYLFLYMLKIFHSCCLLPLSTIIRNHF